MQGLQAVGWRCVLEQGPRVQAGRRLGAGWVQAGCRLSAACRCRRGHLRGAGPPTPALEETGLDVVVPEHVEQPHLAGFLVELAEAAL